MKNDHLQEVDMTYTQHLIHAWKMAGALLIHGLFPSILTTYASDKMNEKKC